MFFSTNLILPIEIANAFIKVIDMRFLKAYDSQEFANLRTSDYYINDANRVINELFTVSWSLGGHYEDEDGVFHDLTAQEEPPMEKLSNFLNDNFPQLKQEDILKILKEIDQTEDMRVGYDEKHYMAYNKMSFVNLAPLLIEMLYKDKSKWTQEVNFDELLIKHSTLILSFNPDTYDLLYLNQKLTNEIVNDHQKEKIQKI